MAPTEKLPPFRLRWTVDYQTWEWITLPNGNLFLLPKWEWVETLLPVYFRLGQENGLEDEIQGICCYNARDELCGNWVWSERDECPIPVEKQFLV